MGFHFAFLRTSLITKTRGLNEIIGICALEATELKALLRRKCKTKGDPGSRGTHILTWKAIVHQLMITMQSQQQESRAGLKDPRDLHVKWSPQATVLNDTKSIYSLAPLVSFFSPVPTSLFPKSETQNLAIFIHTILPLLAICINYFIYC